jgi:RNA polymerase sigma factor (sigma-70 family)
MNHASCILHPALKVVSLSGLPPGGHLVMERMDTDHDLLDAWVRNRDQTAFTRLVQKHAGLIHASVLRQTGRTDLAKEVVQVVFILLARKASSLPRKVVLSGWLFRAAHFATRDLLKSERRRLHREMNANEMQDQASMPNRSLESDPPWSAMAPYLDECLARLGDADRQALLLRFFENQPLREVGRALGVAEDAARKRVTRALDRLHHLLHQHGVRLEPDALSPVLLRHTPATLPPSLVASTVAAAFGHAETASVGSLLSSVTRQLWWTPWKGWIAALLVASGAGLGLWSGIPTQRSPASPQTVAAATDDYSVAGFPDAQAVHDWILRLQQALITGEVDQVTHSLAYPLRVNRTGATDWVDSPTEARRRFHQLFSPDVVQAILKSPRQQLYCETRGVMLGTGEIWLAPQLSADGSVVPVVIVINVP